MNEPNNQHYARRNEFGNKAGRKYTNALKKEFPLLWAFIEPLGLIGNSRRIGPLRAGAIYLLLKAYGRLTEDTTPRDISKDAETFWDLADVVVKQFPNNRSYTMETLLLFYHYLVTKKKAAASFREGYRSPAFMLQNERFKYFMLASYKDRDMVYILRHGKENSNTHLLILPYSNPHLRDVLVESSLSWPEAWKIRIPSALHILEEAEGWFEGSSDKVRSWKDFDATMIETARRHICNNYNGTDRVLPMKFLFHVYSRLIMRHPEHDFFSGSYIWCPELVLNKKIPLHLAAGYEVAIYGQRDTFRQGSGAIFVIHNANLLGASNRKTEVCRYDLSMIENPTHWNALANFILHNDRTKILFARHFLRWLNARKNALREDPCHITMDDMNAYRLSIAAGTDNGGSRNAHVTVVRKVINWFAEEKYLTVDKDALDHFSFFLINSEPESRPLTKDQLSALKKTLLEMGKENPRYLLTENLVNLMITSELRAGALASLSLDDIQYFHDGTCKIMARAKANGHGKTTYYLTAESAKLLKAATAMTAGVRAKYPMLDIRRQLYLYEIEDGTMPVNAMTIFRVNLDLADACKRMGIENVNTGMIRDTMFTMLNMFMIENKIPDYKKTVLTHHSNRRSIYSYAVFTIQDIIERSPRVNIGRVLNQNTEKIV